MPGPSSRTTMARLWAGATPSTKNSVRPPCPYWKAFRAISETAVLMRVWSLRSKPSISAMSRARRRA